MQLFINFLDETYTFDGIDIENLQEFLQEQGLPIEEQVLYAGGRPLDDEVWKELKNGDHIDVTFRLLGGKVHGSLARAGKVKGQTPKVEKQEKRKKKKTGRAKRRMLYNKRFVSVVTAFGRRRGPNTNQ